MFIFWPDIIIVGDGVSKKMGDFKSYLHLETTIVPAKSRNHAGIIGAALAASAKRDS